MTRIKFPNLKFPSVHEYLYMVFLGLAVTVLVIGVTWQMKKQSQPIQATAATKTFPTDYAWNTGTTSNTSVTSNTLQLSPSSQGPSGPSGYSYYKQITITNSGSTLTDYQVNVTVSFVTGKMNADFSDIRFTTSNGVTLLDHWR